MPRVLSRLSPGAGAWGFRDHMGGFWAQAVGFHEQVALDPLLKPSGSSFSGSAGAILHHFDLDTAFLGAVMTTFNFGFLRWRG
eukprot:10729202-Karenia_brevis.AAC.1